MTTLPAVSRATQALTVLGQSLWLDSIGRRLVTSGELRRLNEHDGITDVTSNPAIFEKAIASGDDYADISVNVTLLFARHAYAAAADAYLAGLEARAALRGRVAVANAALAYDHYRGIVDSGRWTRIAAFGGQPQRLLWASTGTKDARNRDVVYLEELVAPDTLTTVPPATLDAFRDHGLARPSLEGHVAAAGATLEALAAAGVDLDSLTTQLLDDGLSLFASAFDRMLAVTALRIGSARRPAVNTIALSLSPAQTSAVDAALQEWQGGHKSQRLWNRDRSLWTNADEQKWLGWLSVADDQLAQVDALMRLATEVANAGYRDVLLLGMGGSSLAPDVLRHTFGHVSGFPELHVLDSTDPAQVAAIERRVDLSRTLCIVSSKSGSTLEPNIFLSYFYSRVAATVGEHEAGSRFIAITDPGSNLEKEAGRLGFAQVFHGVPSIGGRYSALSAFGIVPAAAMGLDVERFLRTTAQMVNACGASVPATDNPGVVLGTALGVLAAHGRDKVTFITSPGIDSLGAWLEQLIAESTGKSGLGLIPVDGEMPTAPERYGHDRVFVYLRLASAPDSLQDDAVDALTRAGHPVIRVGVHEPYAIGQEFFRWEIATAVAGAHLGINPFDQPDVEASKVATRTLTDEYEQAGTLPAETPFFTDGGVALYADERNCAALMSAAGARPTLESVLRAHLDRLGDGDYFAQLAYIEMNEANDAPLQQIRHAVRNARGTATCVGFGPRFLHSTGQAYKGGPNTGVFLQVTCGDAADLAVPGRRFTFGVVKAAQARGDFQVLAERERRALRVHLATDVSAGLATLQAAIARALTT